MTVPLRMRRILLPRWMWPSVTKQPAMLPILLTLNTWRISAWPCSFSRISGSSMPDRAFFRSSKIS